MVGVIVAFLVFCVLLRWRGEHAKRRREEAESRQLQWRPMTEFDARFPADRRPRRRHGRFGGRRRLKSGF